MPRQGRNNLPRTPSASPRPSRMGWLSRSVRGSRAGRVVRARPRVALTAAAVLAAVAVTAYVISRPAGHSVIQPAARTRAYNPYTACLITDDQGVSGPQAAPVWSGMQAAAAQTHESVTTLAILGGQSEQNAVTTLDTLALRGCDYILAAGPLPDQAVRSTADRFPKIPLAVVNLTSAPATPANAGGTPTGAAAASSAAPSAVSTTTANLTDITASDAAAVQSAVTSLLVASYHTVS